jgi:tRNA-dihydrouridine synthase B
MHIGPYKLDNPLILAPMAGITDRPFRMLCREMGAAMAVSEMVTSNKQLWHSRKTRLRLDHSGETTPRSVQIAGTDPVQMAEAAKFNVDNGAQIIDINMGCPAKKVCSVMAGSALLRDESLVASILTSVANAVDVPVTLKIRTGWNPQSRNATHIAKIAEDSGIQALAVHGRTRACAFKGEAEYETISAVKSLVNIPVIANGDIDSPEKAVHILKLTGADAIMIGRAAQGRPWIFREILYYQQHGETMPPPSADEVNNILLKHLKNLYDFYGEVMGIRIARKHIGWYCKQHAGQLGDIDSFRQGINKVESADAQLEQVADFFTSTGKLLAA